MTAAALVLLTVCTARATMAPAPKLDDRAAGPEADVAQLVQKAFTDASHNDTVSAQAELDKAVHAKGFDDLPTLSKHALTGEGFDVIERRQPSLLVDRSILITGEVDRTTDFNTACPQHTSTGPAQRGNLTR